MALNDLPLAQRKKLLFKDPQLDAYAAQMEAQYKLPPGIIVALKNQGERSNPWQTSPAGAQGVMQLMPDNQRKFGVTDPFDPVQSIEGAAKYLAATSKQYKGNMAAMVADYNGGPRQAKAVIEGRQPKAKETRDYLSRVMPDLATSLSARPAPARARAAPAATPVRAAATPAMAAVAAAPAMAAVAAAPAAPVEQIVDDLMTRDLVALEQAAPSALEQAAAAQQAAEAAMRPEAEPEADPWEQQLMAQAVDMEVDTARQNALSSFFGEEPVARVPLPAAIEEAINRFVANI